MTERTCRNCKHMEGYGPCKECEAGFTKWDPKFKADEQRDRVAELESSIALLDKCFCLAVLELVTSNPEACPPQRPVEEPFALQPPCNGECANCWREYLLKLAKEDK